jgi:hypothetical protein
MQSGVGQGRGGPLGLPRGSRYVDWHDHNARFLQHGHFCPYRNSRVRKAPLQAIKEGGRTLVSDCSRLDVVLVSVESAVIARPDHNRENQDTAPSW